MSAARQTAINPPEVSGPRLAPAAPEGSRTKWVAGILVVILAAAGAWALVERARLKPAFTAGVRTTRALRGNLINTVRLTGDVEPHRYVNIFAPMVQAPDSGRGMVLLYLPPSGGMVKKSDVIVKIDSQAVVDHLEDVQAQVDQGQMDLRKLKAVQDAESEVVRQRVRDARGKLLRAQQDIRAAATRNRIDQELLKLAVEEAEATYREAERQIAMTVDRQVAALNIQQLKQDYQVRHLRRHQHDLGAFVIKTTVDGQAVMKPIYRAGQRGQVQIGDQVSPGQAIMRVADLSIMELEASMNQAECELVRIGQKCKVRFDSYPDLTLDGTVQAIGTMASSGRRMNYYIRRIPVRISIDGSDPRVMPDSTASADVVVAEEDNSVIVPRQAVVEADGKSVVYVKQDDGIFAPRAVELGHGSNTEVAVRSGLEAGQEIALQPPY